MEMNAKHVAALVGTSYTLFNQGRLNQAAALLKGLTVLTPDLAYAHGLLGAIYQKKSDYDAAIASYDTAIRLNPRDIQSLVNRGEIYLTQGKITGAVNDFKAAILLVGNKKQHPAANRARFLISLAREAANVARQKGAKGIAEAKHEVAKHRAAAY